jgi:hypothetical protein
MTSLHLGSGRDYRPGAVNLDLYDLTAVDLQADALRLPFADGSVACLEARHLVEHLGYAGTIYALAEWQRVLDTGGTLLLETPERTAACLAAAEPDPPASDLHWLFGLSQPGLGHLTLFDGSDLETLATKARLNQVRVTPTAGTQPSLRLTGRKAGDRRAGLWLRLHTGIVAAGIVNPIATPPYLALLEMLCEQVISAALDLPECGVDACLTRVLGLTARHDPRVSQVAIKVLVTEAVVSRGAAAPYLDLASSLLQDLFPARLAACLRQEAALPGTQAYRLQRFGDRTSLYLTARLHPGEADLKPFVEWFDAASVSLRPADKEISFFCAESLAELSQRETARGVREFSKSNHKSAHQYFVSALDYDADNPWPRWNLARLALAAKQRLEALEAYAALLELIPGLHKVLRAEIDAVTDRNSGHLDRFLGPVQIDETRSDGVWS